MTGGSSSGGAVTGGTATGGTATGGTATGGTATGGATDSGSGGSSGSTGCGASSTPTACSTSGSPCTIDVDGTARAYYVQLPDNYDSAQAYPVVFLFHPLGGSAEMGMTMYRIRENWPDPIYVSPQGLESDGNTGWPNNNGEDVAFTRAMISGAVCQRERDERRRVLVTREIRPLRARPAILSPRRCIPRTCTDSIVGHARPATSAEDLRPQAP